MKKILFFAAAACLLLAACKQPETPSQDNNNQNQNQGNENTNNTDDPVSEPEIREFKIEGADEYSLWEKSEDGKTITLTTGEGAPAKEDGNPYVPEYTLSGDFKGKIIATEVETVIKLNESKLSNVNDSVFQMGVIEGVLELSAKENTTNIIEITGDYDEENKIGAITSTGKDSKVKIGGSGSLLVSGTVNCGIKSKKVEVKGSGTFTVSGAPKGSAINCNNFTVDPDRTFTLNLKDSKNGIKADKKINIQSGTFNLSNLETGFKTDAGGKITIAEGVVVNYDNVTNEKVIPENPPAES